MGTLYLVATPIGNREDLTPRARAVLAETRVVACEDTRTCRRLYAWLDLPVPELIAYHDHNVDAAMPRILERLERGEHVALVSDAGTPGLQDPGFRLVREATARGIPVVPVPGPTAVVAALTASGLPTDRFAFLGFAPRSAREAWWRETMTRSETVVVYESPRRVVATLESIAAVDADRAVCLARELTKVHEEFVRGRARDVADEIGGRERVRGECVLILGGDPAPPGGAAVGWRSALACMLDTRAGGGLSSRDIAEIMTCVYSDRRNAIYRAVQEAREDGA